MNASRSFVIILAAFDKGLFVSYHDQLEDSSFHSLLSWGDDVKTETRC